MAVFYFSLNWPAQPCNNVITVQQWKVISFSLSFFMDCIFEHFAWHHGWHNGFKCPNNSWNDSYSSQNYRIIFIYVWILDEGLSFLHTDLLKLVSSSCSISSCFCHCTETFFSNILEILNWLLCPIHGDRIFSSYCPC